MKDRIKKIDESLRFSRMNLKVVLVGAALILLYPLIFNGNFQMNLGILVLMWACLGCSWNIFGGYTGQVSLGQAMFFAMGAYGVVLPFYYWGVTPWIGILIGIVCAVLLALLVSVPIFKLSAQYFSIATLALGETVRILLVNLPFTRGMQGIDFLNFKLNPLYSLQFRDKEPYYYMLAIVLLATFCLMVYINNSKLGYYFRTIKANPVSAESIGINARKYKTLALILSAVIASVCGSIYVQYQLYVDPMTVAASALSTKMIIMAVIGGLGTVYGPIIGAIILVPLSEYVRASISGAVPGIDLIIYGVLIIVMILYQPNGLAAILHNVRAKRAKNKANTMTPGAGREE